MTFLLLSEINIQFIKKVLKFKNHIIIKVLFSKK